jgi:hypothetical protein
VNLEFYYKINDFLSTVEENSKENLGFRHSVDTVFTFLGCYIAYIDSRLLMFRNSLFSFDVGTVR